MVTRISTPRRARRNDCGKAVDGSHHRGAKRGDKLGGYRRADRPKQADGVDFTKIEASPPEGDNVDSDLSSTGESTMSASSSGVRDILSLKPVATWHMHKTIPPGFYAHCCTRGRRPSRGRHLREKRLERSDL